MTIALKWINLATCAQLCNIQSSNHCWLWCGSFLPNVISFYPLRNGSGDKRHAGETHQLFLQHPFYCVNNSQLCQQFSTVLCQELSGTICTSPVEPVPGDHARLFPAGFQLSHNHLYQARGGEKGLVTNGFNKSVLLNLFKPLTLITVKPLLPWDFSACGITPGRKVMIVRLVERILECKENCFLESTQPLIRDLR